MISTAISYTRGTLLKRLFLIAAIPYYTLWVNVFYRYRSVLLSGKNYQAAIRPQERDALIIFTVSVSRACTSTRAVSFLPAFLRIVQKDVL
jgi:hypothetical protein